MTNLQIIYLILLVVGVTVSIHTLLTVIRPNLYKIRSAGYEIKWYKEYLLYTLAFIFGILIAPISIVDIIMKGRKKK